MDRIFQHSTPVGYEKSSKCLKRCTKLVNDERLLFLKGKLLLLFHNTPAM